MNLQYGKFYWPETYTVPNHYPALEEDHDTDVLIVGGGSSGAQCAYRLAKAGLNVTIADKRTFGEGSTSTNTSLIQYAGDKTFTELIRSFGEKTAVRHLKLCEEAISELEEVSAQLPVDPEFKRRDSLYYASYAKDTDTLKKEYGYLKKHGFSCEYWDSDKIAAHYPFTKEAAIYYLNDAECNPYKLLHGLIQSCGSKVNCFENTAITGMKPGKDKHMFHTSKGRTITARHAILCGGYENIELKKEKNAVMNSSYAIVTNQLKDFNGWHKQSLIWETARPYIYLRTTPDRRIIIGGLDETTNIPEERDAVLVTKKNQLLSELKKLFPEYDAKAEYYLGALYGGTHDGMPVIGMYEDWPGSYFLMGYGDNGTVYSMVLSKIICEHIISGRSGDLDLYLQTRPKRNS
ncbi:FAD-dependent oxidoreductase [Bacillus mangrovi]|uniref:FAD-dependent oxidoreductase n=1 Tax=Metabacillus mangrovi TaxID=1491830 RepID=A0A7X2S5Z8_9BACI|nr:FAD-dependent oxidoreductase [Metabacillus mangrovi]MTH54303.1 FAD-dependent oxidoreductase [Metabacillus mangrovi]